MILRESSRLASLIVTFLEHCHDPSGSISVLKRFILHHFLPLSKALPVISQASIPALLDTGREKTYTGFTLTIKAHKAHSCINLCFDLLSELKEKTHRLNKNESHTPDVLAALNYI